MSSVSAARVRSVGIWLAALLLAPLGAHEAVAQEIAIPEIPSLSVTLAPADARGGEWWVQGQLVLTVRVASKHPFEELGLDLPAIADAETITLVQPRTRRITSYAGEGWVLETVLAIFPRRPGQLELPAVRASGAVAAAETETGLAFSDASAPMTIRIAGIDAGYDDPWWMVSPRVDIRETWSSPPEQARAGDILRRTVAVTAFGVTAERIRIPEHGRTRSAQVVEAERTARTEITAEGVIGHASRAWDLKIGTDSVVHISPVGVAYWDPSAREQRRATAPARRLEPLPLDAAAVATRLMAEARTAHDAERAVATGLILLGALPVLGLVIATAWSAWPSRADRRLTALCSGSPTPEALYRAALDWQRDTVLDAALFRAVVLPLEQRLFSTRASHADAGRLCAELTRAARRQRIGRLRAAVFRRLAALVGESTRLADGRR